MPQHDGIVYVIDDDDSVREALTFLLESDRLDVHAFPSAEEFLARLPPGVRGCVVTDIRMPGVSGIEMIGELRARGVALPVIVMTGHADAALIAAAMDAGAFACFRKPFDDDGLLSAIRSALRPTTPGCHRAAVPRRISGA